MRPSGSSLAAAAQLAVRAAPEAPAAPSGEEGAARTPLQRARQAMELAQKKESRTLKKSFKPQPFDYSNSRAVLDSKIKVYSS